LSDFALFRAAMPERARIVNAADVAERVPTHLSEQRWIGTPADVRRVNEGLGTDALHINAVYLEAGVRSRPHSHSFDQILLYVSGTGVVAIDGGEDQRVETDEFVLLPAGVAHMHGATDEGPACHISLMRDVDMDFDCPIPEQWASWRT
jgi:quercetin dioxygenase-like cupin family protein